MRSLYSKKFLPDLGTWLRTVNTTIRASYTEIPHGRSPRINRCKQSCDNVTRLTKLACETIANRQTTPQIRLPPSARWTSKLTQIHELKRIPSSDTMASVKSALLLVITAISMALPNPQSPSSNITELVNRQSSDMVGVYLYQLIAPA